MSHRLVARTVSGDGWPEKCLLLGDADCGGAKDVRAAFGFCTCSS